VLLRRWWMQVRLRYGGSCLLSWQQSQLPDVALSMHQNFFVIMAIETELEYQMTDIILQNIYFCQLTALLTWSLTRLHGVIIICCKPRTYVDLTTLTRWSQHCHTCASTAYLRRPRTAWDKSEHNCVSPWGQISASNLSNPFHGVICRWIWPPKIAPVLHRSLYLLTICWAVYRSFYRDIVASPVNWRLEVESQKRCWRNKTLALPYWGPYK